MPPDPPEPSPSETPSATAIRSGLSWATIGHVVTQVLWWGSLLLLAGLVDPAAFGTVALAIAIVYTAGVVMEAGGTGALIVNRNVTRTSVRRTVAVNMAVAIALTAAMALLAEPIVDAFAPEGNVDAVRALSICFLFTGLGIAPLALMQKALQFKRVALIRVAATATGAVAGIIAGLLGAGIWALVLRQVLYQGLLGTLAWVGARNAMPARDAPKAAPGERPRDARWFTLLAAANLLALSVDNMIVGSQTSATELGLYTFAFTLGFAPLTQISWVVGGVLFPAAAASDLAAVARRTVKAAQFTAMALLPLVAPALVLAPALLPAVVGEEWESSVPVFQLLLASGVVHAVANVIGESLGGIGHIRWRALITFVWALATAIGVFVLTGVEGIEGAALAHLVLILPLAVVFGTRGMRLVGSSSGELWRALRGTVLACAVQAAVVIAVRVALDPSGDDLAAVVAGTAGLLIAAGTLLRAEPVRALLPARS